MHAEGDTSRLMYECVHTPAWGDRKCPNQAVRVPEPGGPKCPNQVSQHQRDNVLFNIITELVGGAALDNKTSSRKRMHFCYWKC
jgi:hypothetical protein